MNYSTFCSWWILVNMCVSVHPIWAYAVLPITPWVYTSIDDGRSIFTSSHNSYLLSSQRNVGLDDGNKSVILGILPRVKFILTRLRYGNSVASFILEIHYNFTWLHCAQHTFWHVIHLVSIINYSSILCCRGYGLARRNIHFTSYRLTLGEYRRRVVSLHNYPHHLEDQTKLLVNSPFAWDQETTGVSC